MSFLCLFSEPLGIRWLLQESPGPWSLKGLHCIYLVFVTRCPEGISEVRPCTPWSDTQCANQKPFQPSGTVDNNLGQPSSLYIFIISTLLILVAAFAVALVYLLRTLLVMKYRPAGENVHMLTGEDGTGSSTLQGRCRCRGHWWWKLALCHLLSCCVSRQ